MAMRLITTWLAILVLGAGCAAPPAPAPPPAPPPAAAEPQQTASWYRNENARARGQKVYQVDAGQSLITIVVRRGGAFARFGHDHVIASRTLSGYAAPDANRAHFQFRLDEMSVDEAALRVQAGLDTQPSAEDIEGTRANMLKRVLDAERYPMVYLAAQRLPAAKDAPSQLRLTITLHGVARSIDVPVRYERSAASLKASGELTLLQSDFGIKPMSVMGGALTVQDRMELRFAIVALALPAPAGR